MLTKATMLAVSGWEPDRACIRPERRQPDTPSQVLHFAMLLPSRPLPYLLHDYYSAAPPDPFLLGMDISDHAERPAVSYRLVLSGSTVIIEQFFSWQYSGAFSNVCAMPHYISRPLPDEIATEMMNMSILDERWVDIGESLYVNPDRWFSSSLLLEFRAWLKNLPLGLDAKLFRGSIY